MIHQLDSLPRPVFNLLTFMRHMFAGMVILSIGSFFSNVMGVWFHLQLPSENQTWHWQLVCFIRKTSICGFRYL